MRIIGLTGGIGSGKSQVSSILHGLGAPIIDADLLTHRSQERGQKVWRRIWDDFGWDVIGANGELFRRKLGYKVFHQAEARMRLNELVHPVVRQMMRDGVDRLRAAGESIAVLDVPLLIEGGLHKMVDEVWVVYTDRPRQIERIMARDHVDRTEAERRIAAQMPLENKLPYARRVIDNRGSLEDLKEVVTRLWQDARHSGDRDDG